MLGICHEAQRESPGVICGEEKNIEKNMKRKIKILQSDNGGEYTSNLFL